MKIYNYDSITFEYTGSQNAYLDPEETKVQGKNVYLIPACATALKPPTAKEDFARVFENNAWIYVHDYRANYYKVDSVLNVTDITELGDLPEGYILVTKEVGNEIKSNPNDYIIDNKEVREKTEEEKQAEEQDRISHLKCTKRVFVLMLEQLGLDYFEQIAPKIEANRQAKLEWDLCVELERSNPLLNLIGAELGITPKQIDDLFKFANGEITQEEFIGE
jgi:hypothetical protein